MTFLTLERAREIVEHAEREFANGGNIRDAFAPFARGGASTRDEAVNALYLRIADWYRTASALRTLYHAAGKSMQAFMLLALNGGLGNSDIGQLEFRHIQNGWIRYPRPKTAVDRQFPLWKETLKAIEAAKQTKHEDSPYVFITRYGQIWHKEVADSPITKEFAKLLKDAELVQAGRGFYALRHTFRTIADGCRDQVAIDRVMGHSDDSMGANYTHSIEPERLQSVVDHVYEWVKPMFKKPAKKAGAK